MLSRTQGVGKHSSPIVRDYMDLAIGHIRAGDDGSNGVGHDVKVEASRGVDHAVGIWVDDANAMIAGRLKVSHLVLP